jgi:hypothetical protein
VNDPRAKAAHDAARMTAPFPLSLTSRPHTLSHCFMGPTRQTSSSLVSIRAGLHLRQPSNRFWFERDLLPKHTRPIPIKTHSLLRVSVSSFCTSEEP